VRFEVLMVASIKMAIFWVVASCTLVEVYRHFRGASDAIPLMTEAASTSPNVGKLLPDYLQLSSPIAY
jgi:hypothetical protein